MKRIMCRITGVRSLVTLLVILSQFEGVNSARTLEFIERRYVPNLEDLSNPNAKTAFFASYIRSAGETLKLSIALPKVPPVGATLMEMLFQQKTARAMISGSYIDSYAPMRPAGLVIRKGYIEAPLKKDDPILSAVVCFPFGKNGKVDIIRYEEMFEDQTVETYHLQNRDCLQVGPLLIDKGKGLTDAELKEFDSKLNTRPNSSIGFFTQKKVERSFLKRTAGGSLLLGFTTNVSLSDLIAVGTRSENGLGLSELVGLSSWEAAGLVLLDHKGRIPTGRGPVKVAGHVTVNILNAIMISE